MQSVCVVKENKKTRRQEENKETIAPYSQEKKQFLKQVNIERTKLGKELAIYYKDLESLNRLVKRGLGLEKLLTIKREYLVALISDIERLRKILKKFSYLHYKSQLYKRYINQSENLRESISDTKLSVKDWIDKQKKVSCILIHKSNFSCIICTEFGFKISKHE